MEHGEDPGPWVTRGVDAAQRAIGINTKYSFAYGNIATIYMNRALYELMAGRDIQASHRRAIDAFQKMAEIGGPSAEISSYLAITHSFLARQRVERQEDPSAAIAAGLKSLDGCLTPPNVDPYCQDARARLLANQAEWNGRSGDDATTHWAQAYDESRRVLLAIPSEPDALLSSSEIALKWLEQPQLSPAKQRELLAQALDSIDRALKAAPGWPRALAVKGALLSIQSHREGNAARRGSLHTQAQECLRAALTGNPLLKRKYGSVLEEVERKLGSAVRGQDPR